ncbi:MAG: Xaa-Pro peptidase family protein [Actinomycetota bacterium]
MSAPIELLPSPEIDENLMAAERLENLRGTMLADGLELLVLTNPVSIRYATGYRAYSSFQSRIPSAYAIVPLVGPIIMHGAYIEGLALVEVSRRSHAITAFDAGLDPSIAADRFGTDIEIAIEQLGYDSRASVGIERTTPSGHRAFADIGLNVFDAEPTIELARSRKTDLEMIALDYSIAVAEYGMTLMEQAMQPGITENQLFSVLHQVNIAHDGDWIDGRMLCSGPRTNPWYQEASHRRIERGDMVAFDTDMIGPYGYCADISRTWVCGDEPSAAQRDLYKRALDEIYHNMSLLHVGASFAELSKSVLQQPSEFITNRYACAFHGVGMTDEYPKIPYPQDWEWTGYDGQLEDGVVLSVESYVGADNGTQGVKLEQMVQVTRDGVRQLSTYPLWD